MFVDVKKKKAKVREILLREDQHVSPDKASSPMVRGEVNSKSFLIVIDEGAEISVIDADVARALKIPFTSSRSQASAANKVPLDLVGQTSEDLIIRVKMREGEVNVNAGRVPLVRNLGCPMLLGEPAKTSNMIYTLSPEKLVKIISDGRGCIFFLRISKPAHIAF